MDIRNFFSKPQTSSGSSSVAKKRAKPRVIVDSSDSDSDFITETPKSKKSRAQPKSPEKPRTRSPQKPKLKPANPSEFFGASVSHGPKVKVSPKQRNSVSPTSNSSTTPSPPKNSSKRRNKSPAPAQVPQTTPKRSRSQATTVKSEMMKSETQVRVSSPPAGGSSRRSRPSPDAKSSDSHRAMVETPKKAIKREAQRESPRKRVKLAPEPTRSAPAMPLSQDLENPQEPSQLWVEKYKPTNLKAIIGQQGDKSNMRKLMTWLQNWSQYHTGGAKAPARPPPWGASNDSGAWAKVALLSGPPGVGKTTTAYLVSRELGFDIMELNASDSRSKKLLEQNISVALTNTSLARDSKNRVLLMDEVDGMAGNEDRGGMAELIQLIKKSQIPVICMCNDRNHQKIRSLANYCFDLRFQRPRAEQIKGAMMSIVFKEKVNIAPDALTELIVGCNQDVRQVLHHLSLMKARASESKMTGIEAKAEANKAKKTSIKVGPFDVVRKVFSAKEQAGKSLMDKSDLFFQDYSLGPLFTQENYLSCTPEAANGDPKAVMDLVSKAADSFCDGDVVSALIRSRNAWGLLPTQAMFSSVIPGEYMSGYLNGQIQFPTWFGKYSRQNKFDRILQELQMHTRLSAGLSKEALNMDFCQSLRDAIVNPMILKGAEGIAESVDAMKKYSLLREDLDNLMEVSLWPLQENPLKMIDSKSKAAFTRTYNKEIVLPYSSSLGTIKKSRVGVASEIDVDAMDEEEVVESDEEDDNDITKDTMIKAKTKRAPAARGKAAAGGESSSSTGSRGGKGKGKGRGKGKSSR